MRFVSLFAAFFLFWVQPAGAIVIDLSEKRIDIRYSFKGADIVLFGAVGATPVDPLTDAYDVVIVVRGPEAPVTVRKKEKVGGLIWVNAKNLHFPSVPGYYAVAASRPLADITSAHSYMMSGIGFENLALTIENTDLSDAAAAAFQDALFRVRTNNGLYRQEKDSVTIVGEGLFRTDVRLPANVPVGQFDVEAYIFQHGELKAHDRISLSVDKAGFERAVYEYAQNTPLLYGLTAVFIALAAGWLAGVLGKK